MSLQISQETFDEVVKENMEEFDMNQEEALKDAINQFQKQNVNLGMIDISGGIGREEIINCINELYKITQESLSVDKDVLIVLDKLIILCSTDNSISHRNRMFIMTYGGINSLHLLITSNQNEDVLLKAITFLNDLSKTDVSIRDFFEPGGSDRICTIIKTLLGTNDVQDKQKLLVASLYLCRTISKSETNKVMLMKNGMGYILTDFINKYCDNYMEWSDVLYESCSLLRSLCIHDDLRKDMSCAYENGRFFIKQIGLAASLMILSSYFYNHPLLASTALQAAKNLVTTEESVQIMTTHGAIDLIKSILSYEDSPVVLSKAVIALMRNVCADDIRKDRIVAEGSLDLLINVMSKDPYNKDGSLMEHAVACLAAITLRSPNNSERIVHTGSAVEILAQTMRFHADRSGLLRQGSLTIRNISARCPELRPILLDAGFEDILRNAGKMLDVVDEAYGALRDLGCEVHYVRINPESGTIEPVYEQFGAKTKLQFNPIYDDDDKVITERIQQEARAPFAKNIKDDDDDEHIHVHSSDCSH